MKKLIVMAAGAAALLASCDGGAPKANLKTEVDSLSYEIGLSNSRGVKEYLSQRLGVDTAYLDEFIKGVKEGAQAGEDKKKAARYAGIQIGQQLGTQMLKGVNYEIYGEDSTKSISLKNLVAGFVAGTRGKNMIMSHEEAFKRSQVLVDKLKNETLLKSFGPNKKAGEDFIAKKAKEDGVKVYDLFGIEGRGEENSHIASLTTFKTAFGGERTYRMPTLDYVYNPAGHVFRLVDSIRYKLARRSRI